MTTTAHNSTIAWSEVLNREYGWILLLICTGISLHALDSLVVATMMPDIVADIGGRNLVPWSVSLYELGTIMVSTTGGLIALRSGIRLPMFIVAFVFAIGCAISALASNMWVFLFGRLLQGLGSGGLLALSFVVSGIVFPRRLLARVHGATSVFWGAAAFAGPLLGGLFVEFASWRAGFWSFGFVALLLSVCNFAILDSVKRKAGIAAQETFPVTRLAYLFVGTVLIAYAGVEVSPFVTPLCILVGALFLVGFVTRDADAAGNRLLPGHPTRLRNPVGAALTMIFCFAAASIALSTYGVLLITSLHNVSALTAGYILAGLAVSWSLASVFVSGLPQKYDSRLIRIGMQIVAIAIVGLVYAVPRGPIWLIAVLAAVEGVGFGIAWAFVQRRVCTVARTDEVELASGAIPTAQAAGYALGAAVLGIVANAAGFADTRNGAPVESAAMMVFLACVPIAAYGLLAARRFAVEEGR